MKRKIFTLLMSSLLVSATFAQWEQPTGTIMKAVSIPVLDGINSDAGGGLEYDAANVYMIDRPFLLDAPLVPTLPVEGASETNWRAVYSQETGKAGIYILVTVVDNIFLPRYINGSGDDYQFDKIELYFDCNYEKVDGVGGQQSLTTGHYQVAPQYLATNVDGTVTTNAVGTDGVKYTFMLDEPNITAEYYIPFTKLKDKEGTALDLFGTMGFDVTVIDRDDAVTESGRKRMVWSNDATGAAANESWGNMDEAGLVDFEEPSSLVYVESITLAAGAITENNGTVQVAATILPAEASIQDLVYVLENGTGRARIDAAGVVTGIIDGTVSVIAKATDGSYVESDPIEITISNQIVTMKDINVIINGDFSEVNGTGQGVHWTGGWTDTNPAHQVVDGVSVHTIGISETDPQVWRYQFAYTNFTTVPNVDYNLDFDAWADAETIMNLDFEDTSDNGYTRYGASSDATAVSPGRSEWNVNLLTEKTTFNLNVNFDQKVPTTVDKLTFMLGKCLSPLYIDNVALYQEADLALITPDYVPVETITITPSDMQMSAEVLPANATLAGVKWSIIPGTGNASIDETGMVTTIAAGTVTVVATAKDDSGVIGTFELVLTGISKNKLNSLQVYPSIASEFVNIKTTTPNAVATIYNSVGRKVGQFVASEPINVSKLAAGVYFVKINNTVTKFIKK